jgi:hypothetical protein
MVVYIKLVRRSRIKASLSWSNIIQDYLTKSSFNKIRIKQEIKQSPIQPHLYFESNRARWVEILD